MAYPFAVLTSIDCKGVTDLMKESIKDVIERCAVKPKRHMYPQRVIRPQQYLLPLLLVAGACGPKRPVIPEDVETIAHRCYETLATAERTPQLNPSKGMEDGTFLILWSIAEAPNEQGSCIVDGSGAVLLLTSNVNKQPQETPTAPSNAPD